MGDTLKDLTGMRFWKWTVLKRAENRKRAVMWYCRCECGKEAIIHGTSLKSGTSTQCRECSDNRRKPRKHGLSKHPLFKVWARMKNCTTNPKHQDFKYYGGRGIKVCDEWLHDFKCFYDWAMSNGYKQGLTIERVDYDGDYCPQNCTWITIQEQQWNKHPKGYLEV